MQKFSESFKSMEFVNLINNASISENKSSVFKWLRNKLKQENEPAFEKKVENKVCEDKKTDNAGLELTNKCHDFNNCQIPKNQLRQEKSSEVQVLAQNINRIDFNKPISKRIPRKRNKSIHVKSNLEPPTEGFITFRLNTPKAREFLDSIKRY